MSGLIGSVALALESSGGLVVGASLLWGMMSVLLSPCSLVFIPLVVGFVDSQENITTRRAFLISLCFGLGVLANLAVVGLAVATAGRLLADLARYTTYFVAVVFLLVGLHLLDVIKLPGMTSSVRTERKGLKGALILGLLSGMALGPCTLAYSAPILMLVLKSAASSVLRSLAILGAYALGHVGVLVFCGTFAGFVQGFLRWDAQSKGTKRINQVCGILVIAAALYLVYTAP